MSLGLRLAALQRLERVYRQHCMYMELNEKLGSNSELWSQVPQSSAVVGGHSDWSLVQTTQREARDWTVVEVTDASALVRFNCFGMQTGHQDFFF